jgi:hypothetical protein
MLKADWAVSTESATANALLSLIIVEPESFQGCVRELIASQTSAHLQARLIAAFSTLMSGVALDMSLANRRQFHSKFEAFLHEVHGFVNVAS